MKKRKRPSSIGFLFFPPGEIYGILNWRSKLKTRPPKRVPSIPEMEQTGTDGVFLFGQGSLVLHIFGSAPCSVLDTDPLLPQ